MVNAVHHHIPLSPPLILLHNFKKTTTPNSGDVSYRERQKRGEESPFIISGNLRQHTLENDNKLGEREIVGFTNLANSLLAKTALMLASSCRG